MTSPLCNDTLPGAIRKLYRLVSEFLTGFGITPGFEAETPVGGGNSTVRGAVFRMEPGFSGTAGYINGTEIRTGGFTVSLRTADRDSGSRKKAEALLFGLAAYLQETRQDLSEDGESAEIRDISAVSVPVRMRMTPDGVIWEERFSYRLVLRNTRRQDPDNAE